MNTNIKNYLYSPGKNIQIDEDFKQGFLRGKVKIGQEYIFWKKGLRWYVVPADQIIRAYRRIEEVCTRCCCGPTNFDTQKLVLELKNGEVLTLIIGDGVLREAEMLFDVMKERYPGLEYGKVS